MRSIKDHLMGSKPEVIEATQKSLNLEMLAQPTETSCGPTCLHAIYRYYEDPVALDTLIAEIPALEDGGTLAVLLGQHALKRGWRARLYSYNLRVFDPTWAELNRKQLASKLEARAALRLSRKRSMATRAYLKFIKKGGDVRFQDLTGRLIRRYLDKGAPILTGLSSTYLYQTMREVPETNEDDDIRGEPAGHFVVLCGYDRTRREVIVADPYTPNPFNPARRYAVSMDRLVNAILLGILTYDANLLIIRPPK